MYQLISGQESNVRFERLVKEIDKKKTQAVMSNVIKANK